MPAPPVAEHDQGPRHDHEIGDEERDGREAGELQPFKTSGVAGEDGADSHHDAQVPERCAGDEHERMAQSGAAKPGHKPDRGPHPGHRAPAVDERVQVRRLDPTPGEKSPSREKIGRVHFERGEDSKKSREQEPGDRRGVKHQHRQPGRGID